MLLSSRNLLFLRKCANLSHRCLLSSKPLKKPALDLVKIVEKYENSLTSNCSPANWASIRQQILSESFRIKPVHVDRLILKFYSSNGRVSEARSYLSFVEQNSGSPSSLFSRCSLLEIYHHASQKPGFALTQEDEALIIQTYKELRAKYEVFDSMTIESLIFGLSLTSEWRECLSLLEESKLTARPSRRAFEAVILAALKSGEIQVLRSLVAEMVQSNSNPSSEFLVLWIQKCQSASELEVLLESLSENDVVVAREVIEALKEKNIGVLKETRLDKNGSCSVCQENLESQACTDEEFRRLQSEFIERALVGKDVFQKTNPKELQNFKAFVEKNAPFNVVIDGLNLAYTSGSGPDSKLVLEAIKQLSKTNKKILVLGRKHMQKWPNIDAIKRSSLLFLTDDLSQDDPFLLYATLVSGPHAKFCSRDLMKSHAFRLGSELRPVFKKWRQQHQFMPVPIGRGQFRLSPPNVYKSTVQRSGKGWHLPFVEQEVLSADMYIQEELQWACLRLENKSSS